METLNTIEVSAMNLSESDRAILATHLLQSLPAQLHDEDDGVSEAHRRDNQLDADSSMGLTLDELKNSFSK